VLLLIIMNSKFSEMGKTKLVWYHKEKMKINFHLEVQGLIIMFKLAVEQGS
jgi:hypothetical protein